MGRSGTRSMRPRDRSGVASLLPLFRSAVPVRCHLGSAALATGSSSARARLCRSRQRGRRLCRRCCRAALAALRPPRSRVLGRRPMALLLVVETSARSAVEDVHEHSGCSQRPAAGGRSGLQTASFRLVCLMMQRRFPPAQELSAGPCLRTEALLRPAKRRGASSATFARFHRQQRGCGGCR